MGIPAPNGVSWPSVKAYKKAAAASLADSELLRDRGPLEDNTIPLAAVVKNERVLLESFLAHYRKLGVGRFFFIDNGSTDGTLEILSAQPDVDLWRTSASFRDANLGHLWIDGMLEQRAAGRWVLNTDIDEFLVFSGMDKGGLPALVELLKLRGESRLFAPMLDVYPRIPIQDTTIGPGDNPIDTLCWFDGTPETVKRTRFGLWMTGGVRTRLFFPEPEFYPGLSKFPLVRYDSETSFATLHTPTPWRRNVLKPFGRLLHMKMHAGLIPRSSSASAEEQDWNASSEYKRYLKVLTDNPKLVAWTPGSLRYAGPESLIAAGFMQHPALRPGDRVKGYWRRLTCR